MTSPLEKLKTITILYVEDEVDLRENIILTFNKLFKKVHIAVDGQDGLEKFKEFKDDIDVIVSDINMPNKNGFEMANDIRMIANTPIIITTAYSDEENLTKALNMHIDKYIKKPMKLKDLAESILKLVLKNRETLHKQKITATLVSKTKEINEEKKKLLSSSEIINQELKLLRKLSDQYICSLKTDKKGIICDVSAKFCNLYGYTKDEIIGKNIMIIQDEHTTSAEIQRYMLEAIHKRKAISTIHHFMTKDGKQLECNAMMNPHFAQDGYVDGYTFYQDLIHI